MNTEPLLIAWLVVTAAGGGYTTLNLRSALRDRRVQRAAGANGVLELVTSANLRREVTRLIAWGLAIGLGVLALFREPAPSVCRTASGQLLGAALIVVMALQAWNSFQDRRERIEVGRLEA